jgi:hypothetical protein
MVVRLLTLGVLLHGCTCGFDPVPECRGQACDGGRPLDGGASTDAGAVTDGGCSRCVPGPVHWGQNGGNAAYYDESELSACHHYLHRRTTISPTQSVTTCDAETDACAAQSIAEALATAQVQTALANQTLFGGDPRPSDGQVFEVSVEDGGLFDVGYCTSGDCGVNGSLKLLVDALKALEADELAREPCKSTFR